MRIVSIRARGLAAIAGLALSGCALDALRVEEASDVAAKGATAVAATRTYLAKVGAQRQALDLDYVALDPACRPDTAYVRVSPAFDAAREMRAQAPGWLCTRASLGGAGVPTGTVRLQLAPPSEELAPTLAVLDGLGDYFAAMTRIVEQGGATSDVDFTETVTLLNSAETLFDTATGRAGSPLVPPATGDQVKSIAAFLKLLDQMANERDQVDALRRLVGGGNEAVIALVQQDLAAWDGARAAEATQRKTTAFFIMETSIAAKPGMAVADRQRLVADYYARAASEADDARLYPALDGALGALAAADRQMRDTLKAHPDLDAAQRARLAHLTRQRVTVALDTLTAILTTFVKG